jgi:cholesterol oxidase
MTANVTGMPEEKCPDPNEEFDVVVVGSGFGGAVSAYRLASAGLSVCLFERGRAYAPGSFARTPAASSMNVWDPSEGLHGLFDLWSFRRTEALVSAGLGGGSLIYANVLIRMHPNWFYSQIPGHATKPWPITYADLEPHYREVERMLKPRRYPNNYVAVTDKTRRFKQAALEANYKWYRPKLAITFGEHPEIPEVFDDGSGNLHGVPRLGCRRTGQCDVGCNNGSKNTLDLTYLSQIDRRCGKIFTDCEVKIFRRVGEHWHVGYVLHKPPGERRRRAVKPPMRQVRARALILAAGTFGTNFLLMRNRSALPAISDRLGHGFSGNGDFLGLLTHAKEVLDASNGPVITSTIRRPDWADNAESERLPDAPLGHYVQDAGYPNAVEWFSELTPPTGLVRRGARLAVARARMALTGNSVANVSQNVAELLDDGRQSSRIMPMLGIGRDAPDSVLSLHQGFLDLEQGHGSDEYVRQVRETFREIAKSMNARYWDYMSRTLSRFITVHPLGGVGMAANARDGVVDSWGRVFGYKDLYVADGSVMPGPIGPNPAFTIAALADRFSQRLAHELTGT